MLYLGPDYQQQAKKNKHWAIRNINYIYKRITLTHDFPDPPSVKQAWHPEDNTDDQAKKYQHYARDSQDHLYGFLLFS